VAKVEGIREKKGATHCKAIKKKEAGKSKGSA